MGLLDVVRRMRPGPRTTDGKPLPDPAKPPGNRGDWDTAALTNVEITELVKREIRTTTLPWQK
jgi:hypothetical protein